MLSCDVICQASEAVLSAVRVPLDHDVELVRHHLTCRRPRRRRRRVGPGRPEEEEVD